MSEVPANRIDPNVKVPAAVLAAAAKANEFYTQPEEPKAEEVQTPAGDVPIEAQGEPVTPAGNDPPAPPQKTDDQSWEHKYLSMKGRFDRSQDRIKSMEAEIENLRNMVVQLSSKPSTADTNVDADAPLVTPEEVEEFGSDMVSVIERKAEEVVRRTAKKFEERLQNIDQKVSSVGKVISGDAYQRMLDTLDQSISNWREVNRRPEFLEWLGLPDTFSGVKRMDLLQKAYAANDTPRVAAFFKSFLAEEAAVAPQGGNQAQSGAQAPQLDLETLAAPGRAKATPTSVADEKPTISRAEIAKFYADCAAGRYRGKDAQKAEIEKRIFDATREGRIR